MRRSHLVAVLLCPPVGLLDFSCAAAIFGSQRSEPDEDWYSFAAGSMNPGPIQTAEGVDLHVGHGMEIFGLADTILIPAWDIERSPPPELLIALGAAQRRGVRLVSVGTGAFLLAAAGILAGRRVAAHCSYAPLLQRLHPGLSIVSDALYIDEGQIVTGAGSAASLDMFLHLVTLDYGIRAANELARSLLAAPHRQGSHPQALRRPVPGEKELRLHKVIDHLRLNATRQHRTEALAAMADMSPTNFNKKFRSVVGRSPYDWLIHERVAIARELLEESRLSIDQIGVESGFGSTQSFRSAFTRIVGLAPARYRSARRAGQPAADARARNGRAAAKLPQQPLQQS